METAVTCHEKKVKISTPAKLSSSDPVENLAQQLIKAIGENENREGLIKTPTRFSKAMQFLTSGYKTDVKKIVGDALFSEKASDLVVIKNIEFFSLCEHHLLPFFGKAHVAYIPNGKVIGLSKIPRIVDTYARRLQVQERLTQEIAEELTNLLKPKGVSVIIEASHLCMMMRGVEKQQSSTVTRANTGEFLTNPQWRREFSELINR
jgi:GTP cyclohydrolase I